jgi:hypothetical protein
MQLAFAVFFVDGYMVRKDGNWQPIHSWQPRKLIDRSTANGYLMRRWVNGGWQYRALTEAEEEAHGELQVW